MVISSVLLQNDKRQLETAFVVETKLGGKHQGGCVRRKDADVAIPNASERSDTDLDDDAAANEECGSRLAFSMLKVCEPL